MENGIRGRSVSGFFSATALVVSCVAMVFCLGMKNQINADITKAETPSDVPVSVIDEAAAMYSARIENGVVVIRNANGEAVRELKTPVKLMTKDDREYFEAGVDIYTDAELDGLCNDFES